MALFGKLFDKKVCSICGKELGVFGKTKLAEGYLCKDDAGKLSPFFHGARKASVDDIREQLAYREANAEKVAAFTVTTTLDGGNYNVYLDEGKGQLIISGSSDWRSANPDVIGFDQVTGCDTEIEESRTEIMRINSEGEEESYNPPRYDIDYDFNVSVFFNHPYFSEISWQVNRSTVDELNSTEYREAERRTNALRDALQNLRAETRAAAAPKQAVTCPHCGATTIPDANGCCDYCGGSITA